MVEIFPLERASIAFDRMITAKMHFRAVFKGVSLFAESLRLRLRMRDTLKTSQLTLSSIVWYYCLRCLKNARDGFSGSTSREMAFHFADGKRISAGKLFFFNDLEILSADQKRIAVDMEGDSYDQYIVFDPGYGR